MATYTETIELKDNVSGPAKAAADAVTLLGRGLSTVGTRLGKVAGSDSPFEKAALSAERFAESLAKAVALQQALAGAKVPSLPAGVKAPAAAGAPVASAPSTSAKPPTSTPAAEPPMFGPKKPIKLDGLVDTNTQVKTLEASLKSAERAMVSAAAIGDHVGFDKAAGKAGLLKAELAKINAKPLADASAVANETGKSLDKVTAPAKKAGTSISKTMWDARNAMDVGRQSIGAAITGIKSAFSSLAQGDVKGTVAGITDAVAGMAKMLDLVAPGLGQAVSAIISIAGGIIGATAGLIVSGAKFAIEASQAKQAMLSMFDAMGGGKVTGAELDDMLSSLSDRIRISKDDLVPLTQAFLQMGVVSVSALERLTLAAISAEAITKGGAAAFTDLQKKLQLAIETGQGFKLGTKQLLALRDAGVGVSEIATKMGMSTKALTAALAAGSVDAKKFGDALTEAVIEKGAGPLERMASGFDAIKKKLLQDIGDLFEDIDVGPFMAEVKSLFDIFGQGTKSGEALKAGIGGFFKEVFATATLVVPLVKHFLLDIVIWGLKAYIALKPIVKTIQDFFASAQGQAVLSAVLETLWSALKGIGVILAVVVGFFLVMAVMTVTVGLAIWAMIGALFSLGTTITTAVVGAIASVVAVLAGWASSAWQMATDFVMGLVNGIIAGGGMVANAVTGLASGAADAFTNFLGIKSPSKMMFGFGVNTGEGVVGGIDAVAPDVHGAAGAMAQAAVAGVAAAPTPPTLPATAGATGAQGAAGGSASGSGATITIENININGANKSLEEISAEALNSAFELAALRSGVAEHG